MIDLMRRHVAIHIGQFDHWSRILEQILSSNDMQQVSEHPPYCSD